MERSLLTVDIRRQHDVVLTRQRAREVAAAVDLDVQEQTRFSTAVSEIARNAFRYAGGGRAEFAIADGGTPMLLARIRDKGRGIANLADVLDGRYRSTTGMGIGLIGSKRLSDQFDIQTSSEGTTVTLGKTLKGESDSFSPKVLARISQDLASRRPVNEIDELQQQNQELLRLMEDLQQRQHEVERLNRELQETNRGVLALYSELDDKAEALRRASELKSKFLSNMTHELRTPLNSVIMVSRLLLDGAEGELTAQQHRPVGMIHRAAEGLLELVNDLLDLAKIEAGKIEVRVSEFTVHDLLGALRGMFRPLQTGSDVELIFDSNADIPLLRTDEGKLSQILRNFISNALKFTERGQVIVKAEPTLNGYATFSVNDSGIGISQEDQARLFHEFVQVGGARKVKGTGLGLSLSKRLAELLGGSVSMRSEIGQGSTFSVTIPVLYQPALSADSTKEIGDV